MDEFLRYFGSASGASLEWIVVFTFIAVAVLYFLAPVLGYQAERRGMLLIAMYLLIGYGLLTLFQAALQYICYLGMRSGDAQARVSINIGFLFSILRLAVYIASQGALVLGLRQLQRGGGSVK